MYIVKKYHVENEASESKNKNCSKISQENERTCKFTRQNSPRTSKLIIWSHILFRILIINKWIGGKNCVLWRPRLKWTNTSQLDLQSVILIKKFQSSHEGKAWITRHSLPAGLIFKIAEAIPHICHRHQEEKNSARCKIVKL